jgi:hypothetical protein
VELKKTYLKEKLEKLKSEMEKLEAIERQVLASQRNHSSKRLFTRPGSSFADPAPA